MLRGWAFQLLLDSGSGFVQYAVQANYLLLFHLVWKMCKVERSPFLPTQTEVGVLLVACFFMSPSQSSKNLCIFIRI